MDKQLHIPVLLSETIDLLNLRAGNRVVDCTLGLGGHSEAILKKIGPKGKLMAFDQDETNLKKAKQRLKKFEKQIIYVHSNFENLKTEIERHRFGNPDAILFDLGLSSPHVDIPERGFSFQKEGPLDMRYDQTQELTAQLVINTYNEKKLADLIYQYGDERRSRVIAKAIVNERKKHPIANTLQLAEIIKTTSKGKIGRHPATRTFQALRIYVNRELEVLESALHQAIDLLAPKGRIAAISYHSLEDRLVKNIFRYYTRDCICPKELPLCQCNFQKKLYLLTKRPIIPTGIEVEQNPRSRSAKLRAAERL
ncbi:16S rRNA (cytosine(1402)-N(4))-methyltransferase RsmH [Candidatus Peregrinibacteria bacterium]|nr:16S rRNA (cytosine(1402)-N(4))-methyltransferase RsmH [Candidatus Peregrinibacteria bacterium]